MSRFDYVKYDEEAQALQAELKIAATVVEKAMILLDEAQGKLFDLINANITHDRPRDLAIESLQEACLTEKCYDYLEQCYMWCGKGLRDAQIERNGGAELQEERGDE